MNLVFKYHYYLPLLARFPQNMAYRLASLSGRFSRAEHVAEKEFIIGQMHTVFPEKSQDELAACADYFFSMVEREALDTWFFRTCKTQKQIGQFIQLEDFHHVTDARQSGRRVIISSGHFGRFWMAGVGMQAQGVSVGTITRDGGDTNEHGLPEAEYQYRLKKLAWLQQCFGGPFLVEGDSVRPIYRALNEYVMGLFIDVPYSGDKNGCISLPFLGSETRFPLGPAKLAKKAKALIVPFYVFESRAGLRAKFYPPLDTESLNEQEIMTQLVGMLEQQIRAFPEQWWLWQALPLMRQ
ncbi:phosphatidylinositol dimannoside acyltransferase [Bathymodiolus japonicus methanotrophic gill symbiont]|uniref:lysophospholipid acyltransferase family protein n=1 Tax=Bathymodiolus japonicus methanotrophic gill symbiont TaxID=113269 RepID=UPI001B4473B8|nr:lipid A biosynthesis acyltransferase [Bathymodiolus japonicus methanotrophic gill symbiont]GFO71437.1 phosphatidylinositol dimannoside acyltransferase [Bathymodiolus japonicus methanotrophic gill symbiont]